MRRNGNLNMSLLFESEEWTEEIIEKLWEAVQERGKFYNLDYYPPQIEIISATQMLDNYSSVGLPVMYNHWSFGKSFIKSQQSYEKGMSGLAFEIVINTNPSICYIMESNTTTMQLLVLAHAAIGHSTFFKNNYLFKQWTDASTIIEFCLYAKKFIKKCEEIYGKELVEFTLDAAHALQYFGIDKYKKKHQLTKKERIKYEENLDTERQKLVNDLFQSLKLGNDNSEIIEDEEETYIIQLTQGEMFHNVSDPEENLLEYIKKHSNILRPFQKEIISIVQYMAQYFYPQMQTQVTNEGFATFWHYTIFKDLYELGKISEGSFLQFLENHSAVIYQPSAWHYSKKYQHAVPSIRYSGINPYALGFAIYSDIRRMCEAPTEEDKKYFPNLVGKNWVDEVKYAMENFNDSGFILQYLSPKVIRDLKLMVIKKSDRLSLSHEFYDVTETHEDDDFKLIRKQLSEYYNLSNKLPQIRVQFSGEPEHILCLEHIKTNNQKLDQESSEQTIDYIKFLWGKGNISIYSK